jgi:hypothetical protein
MADASRLRFDDVLKRLRLKDADVVSCYLWGSRLWGTAKDKYVLSLGVSCTPAPPPPGTSILHHVVTDRPSRPLWKAPRV